jgi:hypothetical protein
MKYHYTKEGDKIKIQDLDILHLKNILIWIEKKSVEGLLLKYGGGFTGEDIWYDEEIIYGDEVKKYLSYSTYKNEFDSRFKRINKNESKLSNRK